MIFSCCEQERLSAVRAHGTLNGIELVEVVRDASSAPRYALLVRFVKGVPAGLPALSDVRIEGGDRIRGLKVVSIEVAGAPNVLRLWLDAPGDFSIYTLRILRGFDPILSSIGFSFEGVLGCGGEFDCAPRPACAAARGPAPLINYLAKDYASFRQIMLDRMATLVPEWRERSPADLGVTLVELLAYVGDLVSYRQDAVATEAYLHTARRRTSVRRHARLVDYFMHDGCNARVCVQIRVSADVIGTDVTRSPVPRGTQLFTMVDGQPMLAPKGSAAYEALLARSPEVFETLADVEALYKGQNELFFYTWGAKECCLPQGATRATLRGEADPQETDRPFGLKRGDILIFKEALGPKTGRPEDADPTRRHAVRLTRVAPGEDPLGGRFEAEPTDAAAPIIEIEWDQADALPFPLCISARGDEGYFDRVSVALGNIVLADHGLTVEAERLGVVPAPSLFRVPPPTSRCDERPSIPVPPRFRPALSRQPLTHAAVVRRIDPSTGRVTSAPFDPSASAASAFTWSMKDVLPAVTLNGGAFQPRRDLLRSSAVAAEFVVETENDGTAYLRFGDDRFGLRPNPGAVLDASYRVGNGTAGNVGAESVAHIALSLGAIEGLSNPMPARGGIDPESMADVRAKAPYAFRVNERAVTPEDYAELARRHPRVQRAVGAFRFTGSWRTVFLSVDLFGGAEVDATLERELKELLEPFRMAGHDIEIEPPRYVPLEIEMRVVVRSGYFRSDVKAALLEVFSSRDAADGRRGVFHPDNFTFGQTVYLSPLYAAAQAVEGVASVTIDTFQRLRMPGSHGLTDGKLILDPLEIVRLDNDPNFPERGVFRLTLEGGK